MKTWIHPIKAIVVKKNKSGVPRTKEVYDYGNEPSDEEELRAYQSRFGIREDDQRDAVQSSTQPSPLPPTSHEEDSSRSQTLKDQVHDLTTRFDAYWDEPKNIRSR